MRGKGIGRNWLSPFDPLVNSAYSEGNAYQYMYVPHDVDGLAAKMGGDPKFSQWLDVLFSLDTDKDKRGKIGQYWHGNEPSHHLAYLYNYVGETWKTQNLVDQILNNLYSSAPDGIAGNDDCGQISAWYILSSLGFYPVSPGQTFYTIGSPLFEKATIHLESGKNFVIRAKHRSKGNKYIQSAILNGNSYSKSYLLHNDLMNGGELVFEMGSEPNKHWASEKADRPYSENGDPVVLPPYIKSGDTLFVNSTKIELGCDTQGSSIRFTLDGSEPNENSALYSNPIEVTGNTVLKIQGVDHSQRPGIVYTYKLEKAAYSEAVPLAEPKPGLHYDYFERFFVTTDDLDIVEPVSTGITPTFSIANRKRETYFGFRYSGYIRIPQDGLYHFYLKSNDGSKLFIDGRELIENDANHGAVEEPGTVGLKAGFHKLMVKYFQCGGGKTLMVGWEGPGINKQEIPAKDLFIE
jgi:hypothetical protein